MSEAQTANTTQSVTPPSPGPSTSKVRRRSRRPRLIPLDMRERLARLGHMLASQDTNQENMHLLSNRLTADLNNCRALANHWQQQCVDLKHARRDEVRGGVAVEAPRSVGETVVNLETLSRRSHAEVLAFNTQLRGKLISTANPSLSLLELGAPKVCSDVSPLVSNSTFRDVLIAISTMASLDSLPHQIGQDNFPCMDHVKPNFDSQAVLKLWNDIFAPMSFQPSSVEFEASSSCRNNFKRNIDDHDMDHFDRVLAGATDAGIVDMLQYTTMLIGGMHQVVFDDPSLAPARIQLGRACERILREAILTRNLTSSPELASRLVDGLLGSFCHFAPLNMASALLSVLHLAWLILTLHSKLFLPTMRILLASYFLITGPEGQRNMWIQRIAEAFEMSSSAGETSYSAILMTSIAKAYGALLIHDESTLLQQIALLEDILEPKSADDQAVYSWSEVLKGFCAQPTGNLLFPSYLDFYRHLGMVDSYYHSLASTGESDAQNDAKLQADWRSSSDDTLSPPSLDRSSIASMRSPSTETSSTMMVDADCLLQLAEDEKKFVPAENLKSLNRIFLYLIRAEASLAFKDYETCRNWVDEAEQTLLSTPLDCMFQRVFLMKNVIKTTCPFPTGERSVVDEFERRLLAHETARSGRTLSPERISIGVLWRTP